MEWIIGLIILFIIASAFGENSNGGTKRHFKCDKCGSMYWYTTREIEGSNRDTEYVKCAKCGFEDSVDYFN